MMKSFLAASELSTPPTVSSTFMFSYCICSLPISLIDFVVFSFGATATDFFETEAASSFVIIPLLTSKSRVCLSCAFRTEAAAMSSVPITVDVIL